MVIARTPEGSLTLGTAGDSQRVKSLLRQHTLDRTMEHLSARLGMDVRTVGLPTGDVQILATEKVVQRRVPPALVRTQVNVDGTLWVDVDQVKGNRCERIVNDLAQAVGAKVTDMKKKDSYFQLPGEPVITKVEV